VAAVVDGAELDAEYGLTSRAPAPIITGMDTREAVRQAWGEVALVPDTIGDGLQLQHAARTWLRLALRGCAAAESPEGMMGRDRAEIAAALEDWTRIAGTNAARKLWAWEMAALMESAMEVPPDVEVTMLRRQQLCARYGGRTETP
jgi:hypothetical protein